MRAPRSLGALLIASVLGLSACGGGPGSEEDLVNALMRGDAFTETEAECIASAVFDEYGDNEEELTIISNASSFEALGGPDGIDGFNDFFTSAVRICANA